MLKLCPDPVDVTDLQFKLQCRLKVFHNDDISQFPTACSLLSCASRYGLLFVGSNSKNFQVIQSETFQQYSLLALGKNTDAADYPRQNIELPSAAKHLSVNCDGTILAVVVEKDQCPSVIFYEVLSFLREHVRIIKELRLSMTPNVFVREVSWNPSIPGIFTACKSDGSLGVYELNGDSVDINELPVAANASCFCWSPKGKQIAVGSPDGKITQYKPDLKAVKVVNGPKLEGLSTMLSLQWVSNYQFIAVYLVGEADATIVVVDAPKTGEPTFTDYSDICYSQAQRPAQFYLLLQQSWNVLMVASANSTEIGVLGKEGECWTQWNMLDTARAELSLGKHKENTLPVGFALDISSTTPVPVGESTIPPCPYLCILSHQGVLCCFNVINSKAGISSVCTPPDPISDTSGLKKFTSGSVLPEPVQPKPVSFGIDSIIGQTPSSTPAKPSASISSFPSFAGASNVQSTPIATGKGATGLSASGLFGDQATVTPIKPQQPPKTMTLFGGQTVVAPINKISTIAPPSSSTFNEKYASIFASVNPTAPPPVDTVPVKPIVISIAPPAKPVQSTPPEPTLVNPPKAVADPPSTLPTKANQDMLSEMIKEEWNILETELRVLSEVGKTVKVSVGTDGEMVEMIEQIKSLEEFVQDIVAVNGGQSSEIHCLKQNMIQSWAWFEEAKSYYHASKNEAIALLIKVQPLDSLSQKRLKDIEQLAYYIESQLSQVNKTLDEQWDNFQDYAKKTHKVKMPTMEAIFQTMVQQNAVLQKQAFVLKDIQMRLRKKTSKVLFQLDKDLSLVEDFTALHLDPQNILKLQYEKIKRHSQHMSGGKASKLRSLLHKREVTQVQAVKPQVSSWTINQSPASKLRQSMFKLRSSQSSLGTTLDSSQLETSTTPVADQTAIKEEKSLPPSSVFSLLKSGPVIRSSEGSAFTRIGSLAFSGAPSSEATTATSSPTFKPAFVLETSKAPVQNKPSMFSAEALSDSPSAPQIATVKAQSSPAISAVPAFFGAPASNALSFAKSVPSFGTSAGVATSAASSESTSANVFGKATPSSPFGGVPSSSSFFGSSAGSIFGAASSAAPLFGASTATTSASIFAKSPTVTAPSSVPLFGASTSSGGFGTTATSGVPSSSGAPFGVSTTVSSSGIFGNTSTSNAFSSSGLPFGTSGSFGKTSTSDAPTSASPFAASTTSGIFGKTSAFSSAAPPFGASTTVSTSGIFEKTSTGATFSPSAPPFGASTTVATSNIFAPTVANFASSSSASPFGASTTVSTSSVFANTATNGVPSSSASPLGASSTVSTSGVMKTTEISALSSTATSPASAGSFVKNNGSAFAAPPASSSAPALSASTTTSSGGKDVASVFASPTSLEARSTSVFGSPVAPLPAPATASPAVTSSESDMEKITANTASVSETQARPSGPVFSTPAATTGSIFGSPTASVAGTETVFGSLSIFTSPAASTAAKGTAASLFGAPAATSTVPMASLTPVTTGGMFGKPAMTATSVFGASAPPTSPSAFGSGSTVSIFGSPGAPSTAFGATATSASAFGSAPTTAASIFGSPAASAAPVFGASAPTTSASVFGSGTTNAGSLFGSPASTTASVFGAATSVAASGNIFGKPTVSGGSIFGSAAAPSSASGFGNSSVTTSGSIFGAASTPQGTTSASSAFTGAQPGGVFGASPSNSFVQPARFGSQAFGGQASSGVFGQPPAYGASGGGGIFGATTTASSGSIFGAPPVTSSASFGTATASAFGSSTAPKASAGPFGFGGLSVGSPAASSNIFGASSGSGFGQSAPAPKNVFGSPTTTASSIFGASSGTAFGSNTSGGGFGTTNAFGGTGFGAKPAFGQSPAFSSNTFGTQQPGVFSGATGTPVAQSGFGSAAAFPKPSGFGSPPVFGGSPAPAFGSAPTFGSSPSFGASPTNFGTPEKVFGGAQPATGGFTAATPENTGFGNLASQNTIGFGNLAQQANTPPSAAFSGFSSFSSWR